MIGFLRGRLTAKQPPQLVIDVGGVGYELEAPMSTFYGLPAAGADVHLFTHLVVRRMRTSCSASAPSVSGGCFASC